MLIKRDTVKPDIGLKTFWRNNDYFADFCNAVLFQGTRIIKAEDLQEQDTDVSSIVFSKENRESILRTRDVVKKIANGTEYMIIGIENQSNIHYAMALRVLVYDVCAYIKQIEQIKAARRESKEIETSDEFLSGFGKHDKLTPIITFVIYYGATPWDGALSLHDMIEQMPEPLKNMVSNYQMNLVQVIGDTQYAFQNPDVKDFFSISKEFLLKDKEAIRKATKGKLIKPELAYAIGSAVKSKELMYLAEQNEEEMDMCILEDIRAEGRAEGKAEGMCILEDIRAEGRAEGMAFGKAEGMAFGKAEGKAEGIVAILRSLNWESTEILKQLMKELGLSEAEGKKFL